MRMSLIKIRKYHTDCNNNPPHTVSFMTPIPSTSRRLHSEFIRLLFLQDHRETDRFFAVSGVQVTTWTFPLPSHDVLGSPERKSRRHPLQGCSFTYGLKYWWGTYHFKNTYSPITLANISSINLVFIFRCSSSPSNPLYGRSIDSSILVLVFHHTDTYI
jgi:hypothetical protein